jgi:abnormal spindle-like microcephaly-associated protein
MTLGGRTKMALKLLKDGKNMSDVIAACSHLQYTTSLSRECRQLLLHHKIVPILYATIRSCNRSEPHKELIKHAVLTLKYLAADRTTASHVMTERSGAETLLDVMQQFHANEVLIAAAIDILVLLSECKEHVMVCLGVCV